MSRPGILCISMDVEHFWGVHDSQKIQRFGPAILAGKQAAKEMLELLKAYEIHGTWAVVGFLFADNKEEILKYLPVQLPQYTNPIRSGYRLLDSLGEDESSDPIFYGKSLIEAIQKTPYQEIASHTFSHYYCNERGQTSETFEADLAAALRIAVKADCRITSIVFPRNECRSDYIEKCFEMGFTAYRGQEENWIYRIKLVPVKRMFRLLDAYLPLTGHNGYPPPIPDEKNMVNITGSRFFRPYSMELAGLEGLKLARIKGQMRQAAQKGLVFHLWWHPHNMGFNPQISLEQVRDILDYYQSLKQQYGFLSRNMQEIARGDF